MSPRFLWKNQLGKKTMSPARTCGGRGRGWSLAVGMEMSSAPLRGRCRAGQGCELEQTGVQQLEIGGCRGGVHSPQVRA